MAARTPAGILPPFLSLCAVSALNLLAAASPEGTIGMLLQRLPPFALICLEPETMQPFCSVISWTLGRREKGDKRELLWLYEVIAIIVAHTLQT